MDENLEIEMEEILNMSIDELKEKIEILENEIEEHKLELDEINSKLEEVEISDTESENSETESEISETNEDQEIIDLKNRKDELISLITEKQMKIIALQKRLNDLLADEAMENYNEEV